MSIWPQILYLGLIVFGMGISCARFGQQKKDSYDICDVLIGPVISLTILYYGHFFAPIGFAP